MQMHSFINSFSPFGFLLCRGENANFSSVIRRISSARSKKLFNCVAKSSWMGETRKIKICICFRFISLIGFKGFSLQSFVFVHSFQNIYLGRTQVVSFVERKVLKIQIFVHQTLNFHHLYFIFFKKIFTDDFQKPKNFCV